MLSLTSLVSMWLLVTPFAMAVSFRTRGATFQLYHCPLTGVWSKNDAYEPIFLKYYYLHFVCDRIRVS